MIDFKLEQFEGPLDLLLRLIEKNKLDIYDIPIARLTDQYMETLRLAGVFDARPSVRDAPDRHTSPGFSARPDADEAQAAPADMDGMSEFLLMAATLLEIKSRMLLPKPPAADEGEAEDPREALVRKLLEYQQCQQMAERLRSLAPTAERVTRVTDQTLRSKLAAREPSEWMLGVEIDALWQIFSEVLKRQALRIDVVRAGYGEMPRERFTVEDKMACIAEHLSARGTFSLTELFEACASRVEMIAVFLALLEMIRRGQIRARQSRIFEDIHVERA